VEHAGVMSTVRKRGRGRWWPLLLTGRSHLSV
jgi:hypothetical protein